MSELVPPGARVEYLDLDGGRVRLLRSGTGGRPVVLLHGGGTNNAAIAWYRLFEPLGTERRVIAPDFPGYGGTTGAEPMGSVDALADFVARIMDQLDLADAVIMGVSMGGHTALDLALRHPRLIRALVPISPSGLTPALGGPAIQTGAWLYTRLPEPWIRLQTRLVGRFGSGLKQAVHNPAALPREVLDEIQREARQPQAGVGLHRYLRATIGRREMRDNLLPVVESITVPVLFVHGEHDVQQSPENSRRAAGRMPHARFVPMPGCGHWSQLEAPDRFRTEVEAFLATVP